MPVGLSRDHLQVVARSDCIGQMEVACSGEIRKWESTVSSSSRSKLLARHVSGSDSGVSQGISAPGILLSMVLADQKTYRKSFEKIPWVTRSLCCTVCLFWCFSLEFEACGDFPPRRVRKSRLLKGVRSQVKHKFFALSQVRRRRGHIIVFSGTRSVE